LASRLGIWFDFDFDFDFRFLGEFSMAGAMAAVLLSWDHFLARR
jgi:hypothetical protein